MSNHDVPLRSRRLLVCVLSMLLAFSVTHLAWADVATSQEGLPVELVIDTDIPLEEQLETNRALYEAGKEAMPDKGLLEGILGMFSSEEKPHYAIVPTLAENAPKLRGDLVQVEGIYEADPEEEGRGVLRSMGAEILVELVGGVSPVGFDATDGPDGQPVMITGRVETEADQALVRAEEMVPSAMISGLRMARIYEMSEQWASAFEWYETIATDVAMTTRPFAAFARIRAGEIALHYLNDEKKARAQYSAAWRPYSIEHEGQPTYFTWVPQEDNGWEKRPAAEVMQPRLENLSKELLGYRIVDLFVRLAGGNPALGVILMAILVRVAIYPLTKKQIESQRRMQAIQPQIKELQKEHATDKQKFQEEFWALCKEHDCSPLGGCLPMLIQMPILIFLYRGIHDYIVQFHHTSFLWVDNLAQPDIYLLVAYTISMVAFQKVAGQSQPTADPQQQQQQQMMTYMMPLMFFFFFRSFPAAFMLYWLGSNVIYLIEHLILGRTMHIEGTEETPAKAGASAEKKDGKARSGFVAQMLEAAKRQGGGDGEEQVRPASYADRQKQEKSGKRGKSR